MADKTEEKTTETKVSKNVARLVDEVSKLTVLELSELVNALQDTLGVSAMPMVAPAGSSAAGASDNATTSDDGGTKTVVITVSGDQKIAVIKAIREINNTLGLKEAKDMTENLPAEILKDAKAEAAEEAASKLKAAGATVELK